jgi:carbonic anhydrase
VHGWIYGLRDGLLRDLGMCVSGDDGIAQSYEKARAEVWT